MPYHYLDVSLELNTKKVVVLNERSFISHVISSLRTLFGQVGSSVEVNLLKYNERERRGVLRIHEDFYVRLYSALTLNGLYEDIECAYRIHKTTTDPLDLNLKVPVESED